MNGTPAIYCSTCRTFRGIEDWRERREMLVIELSPCGHELERRAGLEWSLDKKIAA